MSSDWSLETYCQFIGLSRGIRKKIRGTLHEMDFECPRDDLNDDATPDSQRYAPVLRPATLVALLAPCQNTLRSLGLPSGRSLTGCGRQEASFAGWVDAACGGLGGTLRSMTIRLLEGLSSGALRRMLGHLPGLEHFSVSFHQPDEGAPGAVLAMLCPACPHLRTLHFQTEAHMGISYLRERFSCQPLAGCPELVDLTLGAFPADLGSLNAVLPRLPCLQTLRVGDLTASSSPKHLDFSLLPHPERLRALTPPPYAATHFELLTGLEELTGGGVHARDFAAMAPTLRRVTILESRGDKLIAAMPQAVTEFRGPSWRCPQAAWETLERVTLVGTDLADLRLVAPRLRHLAVIRGPGPDLAHLRQLDAPMLESLDVRIGGEIGEIALHCPVLSALTLRELERVVCGQLPPLTCVFVLHVPMGLMTSSWALFGAAITTHPHSVTTHWAWAPSGIVFHDSSRLCCSDVVFQPPLPWRCSGERFYRLRTLDVKHYRYRSCNLANARAAFGLAPNLTAVKGWPLASLVSVAGWFDERSTHAVAMIFG
ncbi:hypothetical protein PAPYR_2446 [Paratrimastix pyriformis]|uniref:Uncharacterized protein n=1 Tax=Paratrimastix pyriformis TaxID=342808 RepID=A0ABQ8USE6_9EUKA|nr:hypothetical protein PAPYR_2446 [Paratrimastix pyriformis]